MAKKPHQLSIRISDEALRRLRELSTIWGPVKPLKDGDVIEHALTVAIITAKKHQQKS